MKNIRNHALTCLTATFLIIMFASQAWTATLENGIPFNTSVNSMSYANIGIAVPDGAMEMTISITGGSGDLDLYLKYGSPVSGGTVAELDADADTRSDGPGADETIAITPTSTPALRAGTWYVATLNLNDERTSFTITATISTSSASFSYSIRNPDDSSAARYIKNKTNISIRTEGDFTYFCPSYGGTTLESSSPGVIVYHFSFAEPITEATLFISATTFHWDFSQGHSFVYVATDENSWIKLAEATPPEYGSWRSGDFSGSLPPTFIGKKNIYIKVELYSYGKSAAKGGFYCNTAQHLRYDKTRNNLTFKLDVKTATLPVEDFLPLPTDKLNYPAYPATVSAQTGINPATCKPIGVGDIADGGENVGVEINLENPSGPYDAYLALHAPTIAPNEFFLLGQDGVFHPFSQNGMVKWKQSATGKIDEKPFGEFSASSLPGGTYNFNFMLTPAGSLDAYYLWQTSFNVPETSVDVPDGSAGFFNGTLVVPNATIIYQGKAYEGSAPLAENDIVGIMKDGQPYLYHPAMGVAELSDYNSRRAVGYFMMGVSASEVAAMRAKRTQTIGTRKNLESPRSASPTVAKVVGVGQTISLSTGIDIELLNNDGAIRAINKVRRFAVVKTGTSYEERYYLVPRSQLIPTEILDPIFGGYNLYKTGSFYNSERNDIKTKEKIETFGAFIRLAPIFKENGLNENQLEAMNKDRQLTDLVNTIDLNYCILEGLRSFVGLFPFECVDAISSGLLKYTQSLLVFCLTGDSTGGQLENDTYKTIVSNLLGCALTGETIGLSETIFLFFDTLTIANWIVEDLLIENMIPENWGAYDLATVGSGMIAYRELSRENMSGKLVMHNQLNGESWDIKTAGKETTDEVPEIAGITDNGTVVLFYSSQAFSDKEYKTLLAVPDWGRGVPIDLEKVSHPQVEVYAHNIRGVDVSGDGRVIFNGEWYNEESWDWDHAICSISMDAGFLSQHISEDDSNRYREPLSISQDGQKLVFAGGCSLHSIHPSGANGKLLTSICAPAYPEIEYVNISDSGNLALFSYRTEFGDDTTTVLYSISTHSGTSPVNLTAKTGITTIFEMAVASPNGEWIATVGIDPSRPSDSDLCFRILLISADGTYHRWIDTGSIFPLHASNTKIICFTRDSKSIIFAGRDSNATLQYSDIFAVNIDESYPDLSNITNTPEISEMDPVMR